MADGETVRVFGNVIGARRVRQGERVRARLARRFRHEEGRQYPLAAEDNPVIGPYLGLRNVVSRPGGPAPDFENGVFVGTIRMGYGHYRIGLALASAAASMGLTPHWFDLLAFDSTGEKVIREMDKWYSLGSRISQKSRAFNRLVWDPLMGKWYRRLEKNYPVMELCGLFTDVYGGIPPETPFLATHPFTAHAAVKAGLRRVVNVIPDNCPLGFHLAPGAFQTVQTPSAYFGFRTLRGMGRRGGIPCGVPASHLRMAGHYVDHELASNIEADCGARLARLEARAPRRLLLSVGGAGAQAPLVAAILRHLLPRLREKSVALFLNFGDHAKIEERVMRASPGAAEIAVRHTDWDETARFAEAVQDGEAAGLHTFLHRDIYAAVYTTNLLMRASDALLTKPSELAYYPIPTLFLERVGGHEAWGAIRGAELGAGSQECRGTAETLQALDLLLGGGDLLSLWCDSILRQDRAGVYHGAYRAVEWATE
ncbi:MAG TPA: hypothetical protein PLI98_09010 [Candidatus Hydrogenedentes bacterium]|nr:hypothetical protein [Candidatus Hydrogenedentota bacterium]